MLFRSWTLNAAWCLLKALTACQRLVIQVSACTSGPVDDLLPAIRNRHERDPASRFRQRHFHCGYRDGTRHARQSSRQSRQPVTSRSHQIRCPMLWHLTLTLILSIYTFAKMTNSLVLGRLLTRYQRREHAAREQTASHVSLLCRVLAIRNRPLSRLPASGQADQSESRLVA